MQAIKRTFAILRVIAKHKGEIGVNQLAEELGYSKSTVSRFISSLEVEGVIQRTSTKGVEIGPTLHKLTAANSLNQQLIDAAAPVFEQLNQTTREAVGLSTLEENCVVYIYHLKSKNSVQVVDWTNQSAPLHLTSSGKLFLAASSDKSQADYLAHPLESRTAKSIVSQSALRSELKKVVDQDYAITDEEFSPDVYGIAVPLRHPASGNIVAAITLYGPKYRILALNQSIALVEALKASAKEIEAGLRETN